MKVPMREALFTLPKNGKLISWSKKLFYLGLNPWIKVSSIIMEAHPTQDIKIKIEKSSFKVSKNI